MIHFVISKSHFLLRLFNVQWNFFFKDSITSTQWSCFFLRSLLHLNNETFFWRFYHNYSEQWHMLQMCKRNQDSEEIGLKSVASPQVPQDDLPLKNRQFSRELSVFAQSGKKIGGTKQNQEYSSFFTSEPQISEETRENQDMILSTDKMQNQNMNRSPTKTEQISNPEVPTTVPVIQTLQETEQAQLLDLEETNPAICEK